VRDYLGLQAAFYPYPDTASLYVGLRNGECDFAVSGVEMDPGRAICDTSCPDPSVTPLPELSAADYGQDAYLSRLEQMCCLDYGVPYYQSGFALMSLSTGAPTTLITAIVSVAVLNAATPVIIAIIGFGTLMWLLERGVNGKQFHAHDAGIYFAFVATSTFGFGDMAPVTVPGRLLTVFWTIFTVLSLTAFSGIVSSALTVGQLSTSTIDALNQVTPSQVCLEGSYDLVNRLVAETFSLPLDQYGQVGGGVMKGSLETCTRAVIDGTVLVYITDAPLLNWVAFSYINNGAMYVSPTIRANPLSWAFPSGSKIRQGLDSAVISMIVNGTWVQTREALEAYWFGAGVVSTTNPPETVNVPTLATALVLVATWLVPVAVRAARNTHGTHCAPKVGGAGAGKAEDVEAEAPPQPVQSAAAAAAQLAREAANAAERAAAAAEAALAAEEAAAAAAAQRDDGKVPVTEP
jgi:hypothetical protein